MKGKRQQVQCYKHIDEVAVTMSEVVFQAVPRGLENVESSGLDLPADASTCGRFGDAVAMHRRVDNRSNAIGDRALRGGNLNSQPIDGHRGGGRAPPVRQSNTSAELPGRRVQVRIAPYTSSAQRTETLKPWLQTYNTERTHSGIKHMTPFAKLNNVLGFDT